MNVFFETFVRPVVIWIVLVGAPVRRARTGFYDYHDNVFELDTEDIGRELRG
jgi:hypothetical protein